MIMPLFGGLTDIEILARIAGEPDADPYALVAATINSLAGAGANSITLAIATAVTTRSSRD